jgi:hypothetical protein
MSDTYQCKKTCLRTGVPCETNSCRHHMEYPEDLNCALIAVDKHGDMTLDEVAKRLGLSLVRIKQIEESALLKLNKRNRDTLKDVLHE